jgi:hypothetical protein
MRRRLLELLEAHGEKEIYGSAFTKELTPQLLAAE